MPQIWCAADRAKAWEDFMLRGAAPAKRECDTTALERNQRLAQRFRLKGTPAVYLGSGEVLRYSPDEQDLLATERKVQAIWAAIQRLTAEAEARGERT